MVINFVGNFGVGYVGESADEVHIARELEKLGHTVRRIPRDAWREYVIEDCPKSKYDVPEDLTADINLIAKWHHFYDGRFVKSLRDLSWAGTDTRKPPVFYWVWDFMYDQGFPEWHLEMAKEADLYLSGEAGIFPEYLKLGVKPYYFQMDVCDVEIERWSNKKKYNVIFTGSYLDQGNRIEYLKKINEQIPVKIWSWNFEEWQKAGFEAYPAVYGSDYNKLISEAKIILGFSVEPNCWGYWSNRVGKVRRAGGFLLQEFTPGMERLVKYADFFNSPEEAVEKIKYWLENNNHRELIIKDVEKERDYFTSRSKAYELITLMERYLKGKPEKWNQLP